MRFVVHAAAVAVVAGLAACGSSSSPTTNPTGGGSPAATSAAAATGSPSGVGVGSTGAIGGGVDANVSATAAFSFDPSSTSIKVGQIVEWTNTASGVPHTVTFDGHPEISSQTLQSGDKWQVAFFQAGTYSYHCSIHPSMTGTVTVG